MKKYLPYLLGGLSFFVPFFIFLLTLSPTYIPIDAAEFALCMKLWGVCHPPGFPLYTMLGHFFVNFLPIGEAVWKANLFSAMFAALTIFTIYLTLVKLGVRQIFSLLLSLIFAVSYVFWEFSIAADVFSFGAFLIALVFLFVTFRKYYLSVFVLGLSASHFYITATLAPVIYWYFWGFVFTQKPTKHFKRLVFSSIVFILGFTPQVFMYFRMQANPEINWGHAYGIGGFLYFIRRQEFGSIFLLSNPALLFGLDKVFKQFSEYFSWLFASFAVLPVFLAPVGLFIKGVRTKKILFLWICYFVILIIQIFLLGTIDPTGVDNPFQLNKFYLGSFVVFVFLAGVSLEHLSQKFFDGDSFAVSALLALLLIILFVSNIKTLNYSHNNFSENMVLDAMDELPPDSIGITVSHIMYFGGRYEQIENNKYKNITLLYFPNEKNKDSEFYHQEVFNRAADEKFIDKVSKVNGLGTAEKYVLATISKNLDRKVYIFQGTFEENFFAFLKPYLRPHGLWWEVDMNLSHETEVGELIKLYDLMRNKDVKYSDLTLKQQKLDTLVYGVSYNTFAVYLGSVGKYDLAKKYFEMSYRVREVGSGVKNSLELLRQVGELDNKYGEMIANKDASNLEDFLLKLHTMKNFRRCTEVGIELVQIKKTAATYNNLASCQLNLGKDADAVENYKKALEIDPNFELSKKSLEALTR